MAEVLLRDLAKVYPGNVKAVKNIDLSIQDREFMVLSKNHVWIEESLITGKRVPVNA